MSARCHPKLDLGFRFALVVEYVNLLCMENIKNQKNIIIGIVVVVILGGIFYYKYKKAHTVVVPVTDQSVPIDVTATPDKGKAVSNPNITITPTKIPEVAVVTPKDQIIKDILASNYDKAKTEIAAELAKSPKDAELWYINSSLQAQVSDMAGAGTSADKALEYDMQNTTYWKWKILLSMKKMTQDGVQNTSSIYRDTIKGLYENALKATNDNAEICAPYAIYLTGIGDKALAITYWQKAEISNPMAKSSYETEIAKLKAN